MPCVPYNPGAQARGAQEHLLYWVSYYSSLGFAVAVPGVLHALLAGNVLYLYCSAHICVRLSRGEVWSVMLTRMLTASANEKVIGCTPKKTSGS